MKKTLHESKYFRLTSERHRKQKDPNGSPMFIITWHNWRLPVACEDMMRDIVDPKRSIAGRNGSSWKFRDREVAEKLYTMLILKWNE